MVDKQKLIALQNDAVICFANSVTVDWEYLVLNLEVEDSLEERRQDALAVALACANSAWQRHAIVLPAHCSLLLFRLRDLMSHDGQGAWSSCTIEIDLAGNYRFSFSYEAPRRLRGTSDDAALLKDYVPTPFRSVTE